MILEGGVQVFFVFLDCFLRLGAWFFLSFFNVFLCFWKVWIDFGLILEGWSLGFSLFLQGFAHRLWRKKTFGNQSQIMLNKKMIP